MTLHKETLKLTPPVPPCSALFAHSLEKLETIAIDQSTIVKRCKTCGYTEELPHSQRVVLFVNNLLVQTKKFAADDNRKELLQPTDAKGNINEDFTEAYGFNPFDERTKAFTPKLQGGMA